MGFFYSSSESMNVVEAMSKARFDHGGEPEVNTNASYSAWLREHPSALYRFDEIIGEASSGSGNIIVFLDYDGTLAQIVDNPDKAFMTESMRAALREVARCFPTAIISGRGRDKVHEFVELNDIYYAGSHGMDIVTPDPSLKFGNKKHQTTRIRDDKGNEGVHFQPAQAFLPKIQEIYNTLVDLTKKIEGALVENNKYCISVHSRRVHEKDVVALENVVKSTMKKFHPEFRITSGKKVLEIRPPVAWDKGRALEYLMDTLGFRDSGDVHPIYIGDDVTDEDAFKTINRLGKGFPIVVSSIPKETKASYSLKDPDEVMYFLLRLSQWKKKKRSD